METWTHLASAFKLKLDKLLKRILRHDCSYGLRTGVSKTKNPSWSSVLLQMPPVNHSMFSRWKWNPPICFLKGGKFLSNGQICQFCTNLQSREEICHYILRVEQSLVFSCVARGKRTGQNTLESFYPALLPWTSWDLQCLSTTLPSYSFYHPSRKGPSKRRERNNTQTQFSMTTKYYFNTLVVTDRTLQSSCKFSIQLLTLDKKLILLLYSFLPAVKTMEWNGIHFSHSLGWSDTFNIIDK